MPDDAAQIPDSAPGSEQGHAEYLSLRESASLGAAQPPAKEKVAPASEPEQSQEPKAKALTDEEKSERKRLNDERRKQRWFEERGEMRAQMKVLEDRLAELTHASSKDSPSTEGMPVFEDYLASGKFKTHELAQQAWMNDCMKALREQIQQETETHRVVRTQETIRNDFQKQIKEFEKTHSDFQDAFDDVKKALEGPRGQATALTNYLVKAKDSAVLIYHLGNHPDVLDALAEMSHEDAIAELGAIRRELKTKPPVPETEKTDIPKPPKNMAGRGQVVDSLTAMKQAADADDFKAFQRAERARKQAV